MLDRVGIADPALRDRLDGLGYGFLIPMFVVVSGARLDFSALAARQGARGPAVTLRPGDSSAARLRLVDVGVSTPACPPDRRPRPAGLPTGVDGSAVRRHAGSGLRRRSRPPQLVVASLEPAGRG